MSSHSLGSSVSARAAPPAPTRPSPAAPAINWRRFMYTASGVTSRSLRSFFQRLAIGSSIHVPHYVGADTRQTSRGFHRQRSQGRVRAVTRADLVETQRGAVGLHQPHVPPPHQPRLGHADGMGDGLDLLDDGAGVIGDLGILVLDHEPALEVRVVGGDAGGTGVTVALERLDTAEAE